MTPRFPLLLLAILISFIFLVQIAAIIWHLYFYIWWLDIPVHVLGGLWIGLFALTMYYNSSWLQQKDSSSLFVVSFAVAVTMIVGLGWEIYEFGVDHAIGDSGHSLVDTLMDLTDDLVGALCASLIFIRLGYNRKI